MDRTCGFAVAVITTTTGVADAIAADGRISVQDRAFVSAYKNILGSANTSPEQDMRFKLILDQFFLLSLPPYEA